MSSSRTSSLSHDRDLNTTVDEKVTTTDTKALPTGPVSTLADPVQSNESTIVPASANKALDPDAHYVTGMKLWAVMVPLCLSFFLVLLDTSVISTAIPTITNHFHSLPDVGWYGAAYQLSAAVLQPLAGKLYVSFSNKWTYLAFFALFELGSLICAAATSSNMFIVGRAIAGMGTAGLQNGAFTIIAASVPLIKRPQLMGICQGIAQLGGALGPLLGGALTQYASWRWCFWINLPPGAIIAGLIAFSKVPDAFAKPPARVVVKELHKRLDLPGFVLFAPAVIMLLLALEWGGNAYAWKSATIIGLFCGFGGMFIVWFIYNYWKGEEALIPLSIVRRRIVWTSCIVMGAIFSGLFLSNYYLPIYWQSTLNTSPTLSGVYLLPSILTALVGAVAVGKLVQVTGYYILWAVASMTLQAIGFGLCSILNENSSTGEWIGFQIIFGIGRGFGFQMPIIAIQSGLTPAHSALATSLIMFSGMLFGGISLSASATILTNSLRKLIPQTAPDVNANAVVAAGATGFRSILPADQIPGVLKAYSTAVDRVFYLAAGLFVAGFVAAWGMGWVDFRKKETGGPAVKDAEKGLAEDSDAEVIPSPVENKEVKV
nr:hypothetical protein B0A51_04038 [Rachicladosporium sp. CCFEE 5018]